ncbi:hypothetical protein DMUE_3786 [Dictyocoela muelleri]|nr:hypothetical protein DMUE_3786 [Dictyocoela muelleri]
MNIHLNSSKAGKNFESYLFKFLKDNHLVRSILRMDLEICVVLSALELNLRAKKIIESKITINGNCGQQMENNKRIESNKLVINNKNIMNDEKDCCFFNENKIINNEYNIVLENNNDYKKYNYNNSYKKYNYNDYEKYNYNYDYKNNYNNDSDDYKKYNYNDSKNNYNNDSDYNDYSKASLYKADDVDSMVKMFKIIDKRRNKTIEMLFKDEKLLFVVCIITVSKFLSDKVYTNKAWADLNNLDLHKVNLCEKYLLDMIDYSVINKIKVSEMIGEFLNSQDDIIVDRFSMKKSGFKKWIWNIMRYTCFNM